MKKVLIDILHPAHVHFFRPIVNRLIKSGYKVIFTARDKEMTVELLDLYKYDYHLLSRQKSGIGLVFEMLFRTIKLIRISKKEKPNLLIGIMGPSISVVGKLLNIETWICYDTENAWITNWFAYPLANRVYTPECYIGKDRKNQIRYAGYHELSYLHPSSFKPDLSLLKKYNINFKIPFCIVRFVSWKASHDAGEKGLSSSDKMAIIKKISSYCNLYITSEAPLPEELKSYELKIDKRDIHSLIFFAKLVIGESATMASESAVLGTPAIFISDTQRGYTIEEEKKYGLVYNLKRNEIDKALKIIDKILSADNHEKWQTSRMKLLQEKIDTADFFHKSITLFLEG